MAADVVDAARSRGLFTTITLFHGVRLPVRG